MWSGGGLLASYRVFVFFKPNLERIRSIIVFQRISNRNKRLVFKVAGILSYNKIRECAANDHLRWEMNSNIGRFCGRNTAVILLRTSQVNIAKAIHPIYLKCFRERRGAMVR